MKRAEVLTCKHLRLVSDIICKEMYKVYVPLISKIGLQVYFFCQSSSLVSKNVFNDAHDLGLWWEMEDGEVVVCHLSYSSGPLYLTLVQKCRRLV